MDYITVRQIADKWGVTSRWVQALIQRRSVPGVIRIGHTWMLPNNAPKPADGRENNCRPKKEGNADGA